MKGDEGQPMISRIALSAPVLIMFSGGCGSRTPPAIAGQAEQQLSWEDYTRRYPDTFITSRDRMQAASAAALSSRGLGPALDEMRVVVSRYLPPKPYTLRATGGTPVILRRQDVEAVALLTGRALF